MAPKEHTTMDTQYTHAPMEDVQPVCCREGIAPVWTVALDTLRLDGGTQARVAIATLVVDEYAAAMQGGAVFPPVIVFRDGEALWLADGFHRVYAAIQLGKTTISATIHPGTRRDAVLYAVGANARHGLRRSNADKRRAVQLLLDDPQWRQWSNREIARRCGVDEGLVRKVRAAVSADDPQMTRLAARAGTVYPIRTNLIGKGDAPAFDALVGLTPEVRALLRDTPLLDHAHEMTALARISDPPLQRQVATVLLDGTAQTVREAVRQLAHHGKRALTLQEVITGRFPVIYADPPWEYSNARLRGAAADHYPTMGTAVLCALPVADYTTSNGVCFLWATNPLLPDALQVLDAWGFRYVTNLAWVKDRPTYGKLAFYVRGQHELLLIGVKGSCLPKAGTLPVSVLTAAKGRHSEKPADIYALIEGMFDGPYLELFARQQRTGWTAFGNEVREREPGYGAEASTGAVPMPPIRVLLVEDDADLADLFSLVLTVAGCVVTLAPTLAAAQAQCVGGHYDVVLTDFQLPDGTGDALIRAGQATGAGWASVLMSARPDIEALAEACGADAHFSKGDDLGRLVARVTALGR